MTYATAGALERTERTCEQCGATLPPPKRPKRPRRFCGSVCRSRAYWSRDEHELALVANRIKTASTALQEAEMIMESRPVKKTAIARG